MLLGDRIDFNYKVGYLQFDADAALCSIIAVTEVDGAVLVAVSEGLRDRMKAKRLGRCTAEGCAVLASTKIAPLRSLSPASKFGLAF